MEPICDVNRLGQCKQTTESPRSTRVHPEQVLVQVATVFEPLRVYSLDTRGRN